MFELPRCVRQLNDHIGSCGRLPLSGAAAKVFRIADRLRRYKR
jgi:hypothetical protein